MLSNSAGEQWNVHVFQPPATPGAPSDVSVGPKGEKGDRGEPGPPGQVLPSVGEPALGPELKGEKGKYCYDSLLALLRLDQSQITSIEDYLLINLSRLI